ncbi:MAG: hypothetical protein ACHQYP_12125 [Nitrospiria bacterium]
MGPYELLERVVKVFEQFQIPYLVTGSVAAMAYGEPRLTNDIDIVANITKVNIPGLIEAFPLNDFRIDEELITNAIKVQSEFNIIHPSSGLKVDIFIRKSTPFEQSRFGRIRQIVPAEPYKVNFASPEDVIIKKMEYYREGGSEKHLRDIMGILKISGNEIDFEYISSWSNTLNLMEIWEAVKKRFLEKP